MESESLGTLQRDGVDGTVMAEEGRLSVLHVRRAGGGVGRVDRGVEGVAMVVQMSLSPSLLIWQCSGGLWRCLIRRPCRKCAELDLSDIPLALCH